MCPPPTFLLNRHRLGGYLAEANQRPLHGCLLIGSPQSLPITRTAPAMKHHIWTVIRKMKKGVEGGYAETLYWKHLFFQAWLLQIMSRVTSQRVMHDFIIWPRPIFLDLMLYLLLFCSVIAPHHLHCKGPDLSGDVLVRRTRSLLSPELQGDITLSGSLSLFLFSFVFTE